MTSTLTPPAVTPTLAPVVVSVSSAAERPGRYRMTFTRPGHGDTVAFRSLGAVAMALHLSGAPVDPDLPPTVLAELVMLGIDRAGLDRILALSAVDVDLNMLEIEGQATPASRRRKRDLWSLGTPGRTTRAALRHEDACVGAAWRMSRAAERGELAGVVTR